MCHYCHVLGFNRSAPSHQSIRCSDRSNTYSKVPMANRSYDKGKPIPTSTFSKSCTVKNTVNHTCCICLDQPPSIAFAPCGHVTCCEACAPSVKQCPICRITIESRLKVFFS